MKFTGFTEQDFDSMSVPGLAPRMEAIINGVRPKLEQLGNSLTPYLSALCGEEMFHHVAKHARRKVNPPNDTWVSWGTSKRGYKALPHFQVGLFSSHLFIIFAVIYESPNKAVLAQYLETHADSVHKTVPDHFYWSMDHMKPGGKLNHEITAEELQEMARYLKNVKKAEMLCGLSIPHDNPLLLDGDELIRTIEQTFEKVLPLYRASF